jgi:hypothetical protein
MQHFMAFLKLPTKVLTTLSNLYFRQVVYPNNFYFVSYYLSYTAQIIHVDCEERHHQGLHVINSRFE